MLKYKCNLLPGTLEKDPEEWVEQSSLGWRAVARPGAAASLSKIAQAPKSASRICPLSATSRFPDFRSLHTALRWATTVAVQLQVRRSVFNMYELTCACCHRHACTPALAGRPLQL